MAKTLRKTSISECKANQSVSKFSVSYVRVSSAKQTEIDKTGITRQEKAYKNGYYITQNIETLMVLNLKT